MYSILNISAHVLVALSNKKYNYVCIIEVNSNIQSRNR